MQMVQFNKTDAVASSRDLRISGLCFDILGKRVLEDITFDTTSTRVGVVGRNGSGKSTLARLIAGLVKPTEGSIKLNGITPFKDRKAALTEVGILFQNPDHQIIFPTVREEISFGLRQLGQGKEQAAQLTEQTLLRFGKNHWIDANVGSLSQGQKQLLCLMSISAMQPQTLILDEPLSGLDIPTKFQLRKYLERYPGNLIHITHDPDDLREFDQLLWLEAGRVVASGDSNDVLVRYKTRMKQWGESDDISDLTD
jgi:biotin transport system ATP-binding protein